eukprot:355683-Chlamydomonas_euryale.AAC.1
MAATMYPNTVRAIDITKLATYSHNQDMHSIKMFGLKETKPFTWEWLGLRGQALSRWVAMLNVGGIRHDHFLTEAWRENLVRGPCAVPARES